MPQSQPSHPPELEDVALSDPHATDGYVEVASTLGYGVLVVTPDRATELIAMANGVSEVNTISAHATTPATAGTWTLTVNGQTASGIAFDVTAADLQTAIEALSNVAPGDVEAVATAGANLGAAGAIITLTWSGAFAGRSVTVTADMTGLTGDAHVFATPTNGAGAWVAYP